VHHELKTWPDVFIFARSGAKPWEFRRDDRGFKSGHTVALREWNPKTSLYTGRTLEFTIGYILRGPQFGIPDGFCIFTLLQERAG
jgi:hypothetical protein